MVTHIEPLVYSIRQVAEMLNVTRNTVRSMLADGQLTEIRVRGSIRIPRQEIERILTPGDRND